MSEDKKFPPESEEERLRLFLRSQGKEYPEGPPDPERIKRLENFLRNLQEENRRRRESEK